MGHKVRQVPVQQFNLSNNPSNNRRHLLIFQSLKLCSAAQMLNPLIFLRSMWVETYPKNVGLHIINSSEFGQIK